VHVGEVARELAPFAPERMRGYVEKIDSILKQSKIPPRRGSVASARNLHDQPTVRAGGPPKEARAATVHTDRTSPPPILQPRRRSRSKTGIFVMGSLLGAGVAIAYFGDVQKIRAQIEHIVAKPPATAASSAPPAASSAPPPTPPPADVTPDAAPLAITELDPADAAYDDDGGDDDEDEDELDDAGPTVTTDAATPTAAKPAPPKKHPRSPTRPHRPHPRRRRR